jgi:hypothetical protein
LSLFENGPSLVAIQIKPFFYTMFVFEYKINTFCHNFKENKNISLLLFIEYFKFIEAYHILLTICKAESIFITQIVRLRKIIKISVFIFLHISTNRRTFAIEIKQIVIEIFERLTKSQISKEIRHER